MGANVKLHGQLFIVEGRGTITPLGGVWGDTFEHVLIGTLEGAGHADLRSLRSAAERWLTEQEPRVGREQRLWIGLVQYSEQSLAEYIEESEEQKHGIWEDYMALPPTSPALFLENGRWRVRLRLKTEEEDAAVVREQLARFLEHRQASCEVSVEALEEYDGRGFGVTINLDRDYPEDATLADAWSLGDEAQALLRALKGGELSRAVTLDLLAAGRWDLFRGQLESDWLEAKGEPYDHLAAELGENNWRFELAKDVAAFANSPDGGMIVIGLTTNDRGDGDVVSGHLEFDLKRVQASSYRGHIAQLVYPRVEGFEVRRIEGAKQGHGIAVLVIPPQSPSSRPFLVQGTIAEQKVLGGHVLLPVRREDDTALLDAGALHARIRLGEQVISGEAKTPGSSAAGPVSD
ncbi:MAG: hypothetical protein QOE75_1561 [Solirubrobacterales bacterium]|nr:hypothetical protein [Solirubrobacterales bacterium]